jgi:hypothetical protein
MVATVVQGLHDAGSYTAHWYGQDEQGRVVNPGVYIYTIEAGGFSAMRKMIIAE